MTANASTSTLVAVGNAALRCGTLKRQGQRCNHGTRGQPNKRPPSQMSLKLGTETASVQNWMMSGTNGEPIPTVGMPCTILMWTDRHAATIVKVTPSQVHVQRCIATRIDKNGMSESQHYTYTDDPTASVEVFRKTKKGWRKTGGGTQLRLGERSEYHDYSF